MIVLEANKILCLSTKISLRITRVMTTIEIRGFHKVAESKRPQLMGVYGLCAGYPYEVVRGP